MGEINLMEQPKAVPGKSAPTDEYKCREAPFVSGSEFSKRILIAAAVIIALVSMIALLWYTVRVFELIFLAVLGAAFFRGIGNWVSRWSRLPFGVSITVAIVSLLGLLALAIWFLSPQVQEQVAKLNQELPRAVDQVRGFVGKYLGGMGGKENAGKVLGNFGGVAKQIGKFFSITIEAVADFVVVFFLTLYLAYTPEVYIRGIVKLVPLSRRENAYEIIQELGSTLKWWLIGRLSTMTIVGIVSGIGLWLLGIPLALTLGILAGLLTFVPYVGPIVSAVPAVLIALLIDFTHAVYVVLLYIGVHALEGYVLAPLIQERTVSVPPMLLLSALTGMTILFGIPGLVFATPLTAVSLVLIRRVYIEGILGDRAYGAERVTSSKGK